jgi:hypothetical protein
MPVVGERKRETLQGWKICRHCEFTLKVDEFPPNKRKKDGLSSWCRPCHVEATKDWRDRKRQEKLWAQREFVEAHNERLRREHGENLRKQRELRQALRDRWEGVVPE